ncbi:MAG: DUF3343 domain-containing protein [Ruminococcaceae bacterium]|nr:DUF3343 domain-containing protein [Oscillospiraceae bacterium]
MADCVIAMKSQTAAEQARRAANHERIYAEIVSIDPSITRRGCSMGIRLSCANIDKMKRILERKNIPYGDIVGRSESL